MKHCVPTKLVSFILSCLAFVCFSAIGAADEAANGTSTTDGVGKLYVLNVWGTNASDYSDFLSHIQDQFYWNLEGSGLTPDSTRFDENSNQTVKIDFCKELITLSGEKATNNNVLKSCRDLSKKAGKNDVIFVYMCCHAKTAKLDGDNKLYHVLFPGIKKLSEMDNNDNGIKRSDIIKALNPDNHRLVVLITDSGSARIESSVSFSKPMPMSSARLFENNRLWLLLRSNVGLIDWNSTSPLGGNDGQGELAGFFQPYSSNGSEKMYFLAHSVFDDSFYYAFEGIDPSVKSVSVSEFFNGLKEQLSKAFTTSKNRNKTNADSEFTGCPAFDNQPTQTLFDFKGQGCVVDKSEIKTDKKPLRPVLIKKAQKEASTTDEVGKLYVLNVWGTNASDYKTFMNSMKGDFETSMWGSGLKPDSEEYDPVKEQNVKVNFCEEFITLSGEKATNKNVLETCRSISKKAKKNDVIFVYMSCHAKTAKLDGDNKRYHVLFPGIKELSEMENNENGIKRSDIIQALNPDKHRLVVLITDSSARSADSPVLFPTPMSPSSIWMFQNNRLWQLLRTNTGLIDWNSTSPFGGNDKQGELASFVRFESIFDHAFFYAFEGIDPKISRISTSEFFNGLKEQLAAEFKTCKKDDGRIKTDCAAFDNQPTQTLFDFKGLGYVIDNNDK